MHVSRSMRPIAMNFFRTIRVSCAVPRSLRPYLKIAIVLVILYSLGCITGGVLLADMQLHPPRRSITQRALVEQAAREYHGAELKDVSINAADGIILKAWFASPDNDNGSAVILLHGVSDNREGVAGYARMFLKEGYRVLLPDARAHGESGGDLATYGIRESNDIHRWVDWLEQSQPKCVYGFGESMGAALLLQSLNAEKRFCAVVVESPFSRFQSVAYERAASYIRMPAWFGRTFMRPVVDFAILYTEHKYGIDFRQANPGRCRRPNPNAHAPHRRRARHQHSSPSRGRPREAQPESRIMDGERRSSRWRIERRSSAVRATYRCFPS